jgi:CMP-2-keto-3-deoxyoctulosonic acid synthetase
MSGTLIIIPVLAASKSSEAILKPLRGPSSLERTLAAAIEDLPGARIVVTTDSDAVAAQARGLGPDVTLMARSAESYTGALIDVLDAHPADHVAVVEATHPFRPRGLIRRTVENLIARDHLDSVVCSRQFRANLWRLDSGNSITALGPGGDRRDATYFQEMVGLALATRPALIRDGRRLGDAVGFEVVDQFWALFDIQDDVTQAVAELVADRLTELRDRIE